jgi:hypothetical protein
MVWKKRTPRRKMSTKLLPGAWKITTSTMRDLPVSSLPAAVAKAIPARIRQEMGQKGLTRDVSESAMRECDIDWCELAREQAQRKFGEPLPVAFAEKVKVQRFLLYRGYLLEDIQEIWRNFAG